MPQPLPPLEPSSYYHIYNHANGNDALFKSDENYYYFLEKYSLHIDPFVNTFAYCLMPNHFHFFIQVNEQSAQTSEVLKTDIPKEIDLSKLFSNYFNSYTKAYNERYDRKGSLFNHRFKRKKVETTDYFIQLIKYIHLNPVHHGFVKHPSDWKFSSYHSFLDNKKTKIKRNEVLKWFDGTDNFRDLHQLPLNEKFILEMDVF